LNPRKSIIRSTDVPSLQEAAGFHGGTAHPSISGRALLPTKAIISLERKLGKLGEIEGRTVTRIISLFRDHAFYAPFHPRKPIIAVSP